MYKENDLIEFDSLRGYIVGISPKHPIPYEVAVDGILYPIASTLSKITYKINFNCKNRKYVGFWMFLVEHEKCKPISSLEPKEKFPGEFDGWVVKGFE